MHINTPEAILYCIYTFHRKLTFHKRQTLGTALLLKKQACELQKEKYSEATEAVHIINQIEGKNERMVFAKWFCRDASGK